MAKKRTAMRNITMFVCAINLGLRGGDLCSLKWNNIFDKNWEFLYQPDFVPQKTKRYKKHVKLTWNYDVEDVLIDWLNWLSEHGEPQKLDDFIFTSPKVSFDKETGKCLGNACLLYTSTIAQAMEQVQKQINQIQESIDTKKSLGVKDRKEIISQLQQVKYNIGCNLDFCVEQFDEQMDKSTMEAKGEIEAFCQNKINSIAQAALVENREKIVELENPVEI